MEFPSINRNVYKSYGIILSMQKGGKRVVISTFYEGFAVQKIIPLLSPNKLIILLDDLKATESKKESMKKTLGSIKDLFKGIVEIETLKISSYDLPKIMEEVTKKINEENNQENEILIHITEGRKITSLALLFAGYINKGKIKGAYYITEENSQLLSLPLLNFGVGESKKQLLKEISSGNGKIKKIEKNLKIKQSAVYQHIQELKDEGYLEKDKELKLTELGRMMIL